MEALSDPLTSTTCVQHTPTQTVSDSAGVSDSDATWATRARSFGQVADAYDRWRPGYPDALYDDLLVLAAGSGTRPGGAVRVLEAGAGTGRATVALAERSAKVVAVEPDPQMAQVVRRRTEGLPVLVVESTFEGFAAEPGRFDLLVSAQAWHWVDQAAGPAAAAKALRPGGVVALWWNRPGELTGPTWDAIRAAYRQHAPDVGTNSVAMNWSGTDSSTESGQWQGFSPWTRRDYTWTKTYDSTSYPALVQTHSDHVLLPADQREALVAAVADVILEHGDRLEYSYRTVLLHAVRAG